MTMMLEMNQQNRAFWDRKSEDEVLDRLTQLENRHANAHAMAAKGGPHKRHWLEKAAKLRREIQTGKRWLGIA